MRKQWIGTGRNSSKRIKRLAWTVILVAVLALGATAAIAMRASQAKDSAAQPNNGQAMGSLRSAVGLRVGTPQIPINAQTGQVRPLTQEEAQALAQGIKQLVNQSTDGLKTVRHADGSVSIDLEGRFQSIAVAKKDEDGTVTQSCVDNPQSAAAFFGIDPQLVGVQGTASKASGVLKKGRNQ